MIRTLSIVIVTTPKTSFCQLYGFEYGTMKAVMIMFRVTYASLGIKRTNGCAVHYFSYKSICQTLPDRFYRDPLDSNASGVYRSGVNINGGLDASANGKAGKWRERCS